jgi:hypothetical protein
MGPGAVIYVSSFIMIGSGVQKLIRGIHRHTHTRTATRFFKIRKIGSKLDIHNIYVGMFY